MTSAVQSGSTTRGVKSTAAIILYLFFLSGACSLVYQLIWVRMLVVVFGVSTYAVSTVLTAFMAGLALGSLCFGRIVDRRGKALETYALLELAIGGVALVLPFVFASLEGVYSAIFHHTGSAASFGVARFAITFAVLLVPTTMMGATLPVLSRFAIERVTDAGAGVGKLYAVNTLGAACGCLLTAFVLLPNMGTWGATWVAAVGNGLVGLGALYLSRSSAGEIPQRPATDIAAESTGTPPDRELPPWIGTVVLVGIGVSGFAALGYEVVWTRLLNILNRTTTTQGLSVILVAFLVGIAAGSAVGVVISRRVRDAVLALGATELLIGLFGLVSTGLIGGVPAYFDLLGDAFELSWKAELFAAALVVMAIPTCLMGIAFPLASRLHVRRLDRVGSSVGDVYAANTAGAIAGAFAAGFILVPLSGTQGAVEVLAWFNIAAGTALVIVSPLARAATRLRVLLAAGAAVLILHAALPDDLFVRLLAEMEPDGKLIHHSENAAGTVTVHEKPSGNRALRVNGTGEVRDDFASIQTFRMLGNLPPLLHGNPGQVLVVAFGGGVTLSSVEIHRPEQLSCVEIVPGVFKAARHFAAYNNGISDRLASDQLRLIAEDGRNHLLRTDDRYDIIICDSTHPTTADSWLLYTREFYELCQMRLTGGGMMAQWVPTHGLSAEEYRTIVRTFSAVFPHCSIWLNQIYTILLATPESMQIDLDVVNRRLARPAVAENLGKVELDSPLAFLSMLGLDEEAVARYAGDGVVNTDARTYAGYLRENESGLDGSEVLASLRPFLVSDTAPWLNASDRQSQLIARRLQAREHSLAGLIHMMKAEREQAREQFRAARAIDDGEVMARRLQRVLQQEGSGG